jgi:hypothetical protein
VKIVKERGIYMCVKCVRKAKRLGYKPLTYGQIKYFAHQAMIPWTSIPLFMKYGINAAIEGHMYKIGRKKTNKKIYKRKRYKGE